MITREDLGWDERFEQAFAPHREKGLIPGRVVVEYGRVCEVWTDQGVETAVVGGVITHQQEASEWPKVGDWVALAHTPGADKALIEAVLERRTRFARKVPGRNTEEQVLAANVDTIFIVEGLDRFNLRLLERYSVMVRAGGIEPVVVLNKADLHAKPAKVQRVVSRATPGLPVLVTSAVTGYGMEDLAARLQPRRTCAFIGPSGAGKSSLINRLLGEERLPIGEVREKDAKGRHTTTRRELVILPDGSLLIDTPGMREFQLWEAQEGLDTAFPDVAELAPNCRFADCTHENEPGCAVRQAAEDGRLDPDRYDSYLKLRHELEHLKEKQDQFAWAARKRHVKSATRAFNKFKKGELPPMEEDEDEEGAEDLFGDTAEDEES
ncbi:MAG: ribosome small subunit-dependent GTPase A [Candidatus Zixiibacteriota bacterium]|nr:MAG: ribosome small subunit-dependent GTPase A [candidate division Zixibacteria bacterium]